MKFLSKGVLWVWAILGLGVLAIGAPAERKKWEGPGGEVVKGRLVDVLGPLALIARHDNEVRFVALEGLSDESLDSVNAFLQRQPAGPVTWKQSTRFLTQAMSKRLRFVEGDKLGWLDRSDTVEPRLYLIYYTAGWCVPCHEFYPKLRAYYDAMQREYPGAVELICVSQDRNSLEQSEYARKQAMPWPLLDFGADSKIDEIWRWKGNGIPCLALVTRDGELVFHTYQGEKFLGPGQVLQRLLPLLPFVAQPNQKIPENHRLAVRAHRLRVGSGDAPAEVHFVGLTAEAYQGLKFAPFRLRVKVSAEGKVAGLADGQELPVALRARVEKDLERWRFLPAIAKGGPVASEVTVEVAPPGGQP